MDRSRHKETRTHKDIHILTEGHMCRYTHRHIHVHTHLFPWITLVGFPKPLTQDTLFDIQLLPLRPSCSGADRKVWSELSVHAHCDLLLLGIPPASHTYPIPCCPQDPPRSVVPLKSMC